MLGSEESRFPRCCWAARRPGNERGDGQEWGANLCRHGARINVDKPYKVSNQIPPVFHWGRPMKNIFIGLLQIHDVCCQKTTRSNVRVTMVEKSIYVKCVISTVDPIEFKVVSRFQIRDWQSSIIVRLPLFIFPNSNSLVY